MNPSSTEPSSLDISRGACGGDTESLASDDERSLDKILVATAEYGHAHLLDLLIRAGVGVNSRDHDESTALSRASHGGHFSCVDVLLQAGADVNKKTKEENLPLITAAESGNVECLRKLLTAPEIVVNSRNSYGETAFFSAARRGHRSCLELLVDADGIDPNARDNNGTTPLMAAVTNDYPGCVFFLLRVARADVNALDKDGKSAIFYAIQNVNQQCIQMLFKVEGLRVHTIASDGYSLLDVACDAGDQFVVKELLERGVRSQRSTDKTPLMYMAAMGECDWVELLLLQGANAGRGDRNNRSALYFAAANRHYDCLIALISYLTSYEQCCYEIKLLFVGSATLHNIFNSLPILFDARFFQWNWYPSYRRRVLRSFVQALVVHGVQPRTFRWEGAVCTPLFHAFIVNDVGLAKYILANLYVTLHDVHHFFTDDNLRRRVDQEGTPQTRAYFQRVHRTSVSRETMALLDIYRRLSRFDNRHQAVDDYYIWPEMFNWPFLARISFRWPIRWVYVQHWDYIEVDGFQCKPPVWTAYTLEPRALTNYAMPQSGNPRADSNNNKDDDGDGDDDNIGGGSESDIAAHQRIDDADSLIENRNPLAWLNLERWAEKS